MIMMVLSDVLLEFFGRFRLDSLLKATVYCDSLCLNMPIQHLNLLPFNLSYLLPNARPASDIPNEPNVTTTNDV